MDKTVYTYVASCLFGLEKFVGQQIDELGYKRIETLDGRVVFEGDKTAAARCNIFLRYAERLYIRLGEEKCDSFDSLFEFTKSLPWEEFIGKSDAFPVKGHSVRSKLFSIPDIQKIVKKAVADRLSSVYSVSWLEESGIKNQIEFFILNDKASLMIDISGLPLHKRGYRPVALEAPLRETLAAGLVATSRLREGLLLKDPFCGSGTIPVEAALYMTNTPAGINLRFSAESHPFFGQKLFDDARLEGLAGIKRDVDFECVASDIDPRAVELARENARRAGVEKYIRFRLENALDITTEGRKGTVICNPPYGERLSDAESVDRLYRAMGVSFAKLDSWQIYVLTSDEDFERKYGRRADKRKRLYNGMLRCNLYQYFRPLTEKKH